MQVCTTQPRIDFVSMETFKQNFDRLSFLKYKSSLFRIINERKQPSYCENYGRISDKFSV